MSYKQQIAVAEQLIEKVPIPSLPKSVLDLQQLYANTDLPDPVEVKNLIAANPFIAGELVSIANIPSLNSSHMHSQVSDLNGAIFRLGNKFIKNYVMAIAVKQMLQGNHIDGLTHHSQMIAEISAIVAPYTRKIRTDEAYLLGLLHDIGSFVITSVDSKYGQVFIGSLTKHYSVEIQEYEKYGTTHAAVGYVIARNWLIPKSITQAILLHHSDRLDLIEENPKLGLLVAMTEIAHALEIKEFKPHLHNAENQQVLENSQAFLALSDEEMHQIHTQLTRHLAA